MDVLAIRWESLIVVLALGVLALWSLAEASRNEPTVSPSVGERQIMLEVRRPGKQPDRIPFTDGATLGRSRACQITFNDATVSKEHARLRLDGHDAIIEDLQSTNGTLVNGKAIDGPTSLRRGDRIALGSNLIVFVGEVSIVPSRANE
jgi:hypothetical protein